ncbi:acyl-CoA dehydrogenase family protein [Xenorhabdus bovienii]|uniref:Acyl-CoA dehydrogenase domain protein n=1 Tax=Xenorhabdus bovienii str. kraussei Quebec TaxID=1398203 RepID=A0A077PJM4_XENBV|nr:acyl-CoA dehydrogenase family protein [Xenorhabdus bovienii]MDE9565823.1 acyl-CoA dehydrogenase family protein [Xenorhabdus bovienii]CDH20931.1 Acyl-CoA dehydrogenase domain protein [Xenorhabdus bovienii str. kraussei Quebec]
MNQLISHDIAILKLPLYQPEHVKHVTRLDAWCQQQQTTLNSLSKYNSSQQARAMLKLLGQAGWLRHLISQEATPTSDARSLCLFRQTLAYFDDLLDFAYSIQSLSGSVIQRFGTEKQRQHYLPRLAEGEWAAAFALSELQAGSDVAAVTLSAKRQGDSYVLNGQKAWIAQGDIADCLIVIARTGEGPGALGLSAFIVDAFLPGVSHTTLGAIAPRSWAHLRFDNVRVPMENILGKSGQGFIIALDILDRFRMTVGGAAIGFSRRAADIALRHALQRKIYQGRLLDLQMVKAALAKMEIALSASSLLTAQAAWHLDHGRTFAKYSAVAKYFATEQAGKIVDDAIQILGAAGVVAGSQLERLYRQIRPLRIYEGSSETLLMNIASTLDAHRVQHREDLQ